MRRQMLRSHGPTREHDQIERLGQQVHQHRIGGHSGATGTGEHAPPLDAGHHHFDVGTAQHIDQGHCLQVIDALGEGNQCS
ncbi:hypothetical protein D3C87_1732170 [compost metagenome]